MGSKPIVWQECPKCHKTLRETGFLQTKSPFFPSGYTTLCADCVESLIVEGEENWNSVDKVCQLLDVPFVPARWAELYEQQGTKAIIPYSKIFLSAEYERIGWGEYQRKYKELQEQGTLGLETVPGMEEEKLRELQKKWGANYDPEELNYLENLFQGIQNTQHVNGELQLDQVLKLCKMSLIIDSRIREGADIDKYLGSYEKLVKIGDFTPKNSKNAEDFDSVGEIFAYLEKKGWQNKFYDGVKRDIVDVTMANIQNFCQRLYTQEPGIGEDIEKRIQSLQNAREIEDSMGMLDDYTGIDEISDDDIDAMLENQEFDAGIGDDR